MNDLTPEQALAHLDEVAQKYHGTRADHATLQTSARVIAAALADRAATLAQVASLRALLEAQDGAQIAAPFEDPPPKIDRRARRNGAQPNA